ncbi:MAG: hypothetical protein AAF722_13270 [Cyanobacteria bacterium P01_C01_bin.70]
MSIRLPEPLADELKAKAFEEGVSVTEMINRFTRLGLRFGADERLPFIGFPEGNGNGHGHGSSHAPKPVHEQSNGYPSTQLLLAAESPEPDGPVDEQRKFLTDFENFIVILEASMSFLTDERNRERVVETIGELAKLKTLLKLDPYFRK